MASFLPPTTESSPAVAGALQTDFVSFANRAGLRVAACLDHAGAGWAAAPWVVVAPKYGETKKNNLQLAYQLAVNGLNVLRFDHTNHLGESEGDPTAFTLPGGVDDILGAMDYLAHTHAAAGAILLANSLSARTAIRATALDRRFTHLVCLVGVVNVRHTLREVYQEDLVGNHLAGKQWGLTDILGVEIDFDRFLAAAVGANMHDLTGTRQDLVRMRAEATFFPAEKDVWVPLGEVRAAAAGLATVKIHPIAGAMHEIRENPAAAESAMHNLVRTCVEQATGRPGPPGAPVAPDKRLVLRQNKVERDRLRESRPLGGTETEFWGQYLAKYRMLDNVSDYRGYLDIIGGLLGPVGEGEIVLDAGCGNGFFGVWLLRDLLAREPARWSQPPVYLGLDLTLDGLRDAWEQQAELAQRLARRSRAAAGAAPTLAYARVNLDEWAGAPPGGELVTFADGCFDKICCSLVLSYLRRPGELLGELHRVLRPGGRLVLSSMKPFCDMSAIYRDFMAQRVTGEERESGRDLLRAAGAIKRKEEQGHYSFYFEEELRSDAVQAGFHPGRWQNCFGNQAVALAAVK